MVENMMVVDKVLSYNRKLQFVAAFLSVILAQLKRLGK